MAGVCHLLASYQEDLLMSRAHEVDLGSSMNLRLVLQNTSSEQHFKLIPELTESCHEPSVLMRYSWLKAAEYLLP